MRNCQKLVERQHLQNFIELFQGLKCKATDKGYCQCEQHLGVNTDLNEEDILLAHAAVT